MTIDIRIANLAVNLQCNIFVDKFGHICLLRKFYNDEGVNIKNVMNIIAHTIAKSFGLRL